MSTIGKALSNLIRGSVDHVGVRTTGPGGQEGLRRAGLCSVRDASRCMARNGVVSRCRVPKPYLEAHGSKKLLTPGLMLQSCTYSCGHKAGLGRR